MRPFQIKAFELYFPVVLFGWMKPQSVIVQMKTVEQCYHLALLSVSRYFAKLNVVTFFVVVSILVALQLNGCSSEGN